MSSMGCNFHADDNVTVSIHRNDRGNRWLELRNPDSGEYVTIFFTDSINLPLAIWQALERHNNES